MTPKDVYVQTEKGRELVRTRKDAMPNALRIVFFMIDGRTTAEELVGQLSGLGVTEESFDQLLLAGCIAPRPLAPPRTPSEARRAEAPAAAPASEEDRFRTTRQFLNETVVNASGLRSFFFTLRLEKCNSLQDLRELLPDYSKLMLGSAGKLEADVLIRRARELLSDRGPARSDPRTR